MCNIFDFQWFNFIEYEIYDKSDIFDKSYLDALTRLIHNLIAQYYPNAVLPDVIYKRLYDKTESPESTVFYLPSVIMTNTEDLKLNEIIRILENKYKLQIRIIKRPGNPHEQIQFCPVHEWELADFWLSIRGDIYDD